MYESEQFMSRLICVVCKGRLDLSNTPRQFSDHRHVGAELHCSACSAVYPVVEGIPVVFEDAERIKVLIDPGSYESQLARAKETIKSASQLAGSELEKLQNEDSTADALGWEILFWEKWKEDDEGFLEGDRNRIDSFLEHDIEGGGRLEFLRKVKSYNRDGTLQRLLNIGAGRDYLLERFIEAGYQVVEQDVVLEPLLHLKRRGAHFCVCCDARSLPFADDAFDVLTSFGVLHHIWPLEVPIGELLRVTLGNVHLNEPNIFALTRAGLLLPGPVKRRLKKLYSGEGSHSPYEKSINPYAFKRAVSGAGGKCIDLSFQKDSWIGRSGVVKTSLWAINMVAVQAMPVVSAHFDAVITKDAGLGTPGRDRKPSVGAGPQKKLCETDVVCS